MNDLPFKNAGSRVVGEEQQGEGEEQGCFGSCNPIIPTPAIYLLLLLFTLGLGFSIFILVVVHNALFFLVLLCFSALLAAFLLWNSLNNSGSSCTSRRNGALLSYLHFFPDSDLSLAAPGQLVKLTGVASCGSVSLESSYEKVNQCIYTSTLLYEFEEPGLKPIDDMKSCFQWRLAYSEDFSWQRYSTDFYITDRRSGIRALVKAGTGCKVIPLIIESRLVKTTRKCKVLSSTLGKWLIERNLSAEARLLRLEEGYIKEGSSVSVIGMCQRQNDTVMIVQPQETLSTGCLWRKLLLPVDVDGLLFGAPNMADPASH
ncbi:uncharacterized membrane protein At1g16860-like isoform X1 [Coffea arabica]|uniref:Uncharacterized membrane protein At1g16860-like isoform X1 n=1 Tax=Coffea arabica TaxID=13443 RepID=A0A6P6VZI7_COFAR|nr:uncharacterized membrane protein At1g16860-like isoform X1 [Coffea arabica]